LVERKTNRGESILRREKYFEKNKDEQRVKREDIFYVKEFLQRRGEVLRDRKI
jgi:hypothetical protein